MNRKQRRATSKLEPQAAGSAAAGPGDALFVPALQLHQAGRLSDAEALYRNVLALAPRHTGALTYLGVLYHQTGRSEAGINLIRQAIATNRDDAEPRYSLGLIHANLGQYEEAIAQTRRALKLNPAHAEARTNLGVLLLRHGQTREAIDHLTRALALNPSPAAYENLSQALHDDGRPGEALDVVLRGLREGGSANLKSVFVLIAQTLDAADAAAHDGFADALIRALRETWCRPRDIAGLATALVLREPAIAAAMRRLGADDDALAGALLDPALSSDPLLLELMTTVPVAHVDLERLLTALRGALLSRYGAARSPAPDHLVGFAVALARQCFINEYVFDVTEAETRQLAALDGALAAKLLAGEPVDPLMLAISAAYAPLSRHAGIDRLHAAGDTIEDLITQQVREPHTERAIRATIPALTPIADATSAAVRQQYEENPYPRWNAVASGQPPLPVDHYIRARFPDAPYRPLGPRPIDLLIAGCGTGLHAIERVMQFQPAQTLAIDLSLTSLSYAARKSREAGISGIAFAQADILALPALGRQFDVVDASGVLHHLRDPFEGWRKLAAVLRPGGLMHVGLYSALAREDIRAVREMAAARGYPSTPEGIRALRRDIMALGADDPRRRVSSMTDFFSSSDCRDLLLHVEEHQLSIAEIAAFLAAEGFTFLGFETPATARYRVRFPDDPAATRLANWARFETENPATFARMYQFWIQKQPGADA